MGRIDCMPIFSLKNVIHGAKDGWTDGVATTEFVITIGRWLETWRNCFLCCFFRKKWNVTSPTSTGAFLWEIKKLRGFPIKKTGHTAPLHLPGADSGPHGTSPQLGCTQTWFASYFHVRANLLYQFNVCHKF